MAPQETEYLTTRRLAEMLRIKERKVYDLAASGQVPCSGDGRCCSRDARSRHGWRREFRRR